MSVSAHPALPTRCESCEQLPAGHVVTWLGTDPFQVCAGCLPVAITLPPAEVEAGT